MPDIAPAPPQAAAAPAPSAPQSGGIDGLMADLDRQAAASPPEPSKPDPAKPEPAKPAAKPPEAAKPSDDEAVIKSNPKAWKVFESFKKSAAAKEKALQDQVDAIKNKPVEGVADAGKIKALEDRIAELSEGEKTWKQRAAEADFTRSEEYSNKFVMPYNRELRQAIEEVKNLTVSFTDDGETKTRQATEADFRKALSLPISEQDAFIHDSFGRSAHRVMARINEIGRIRAAAELAVSEHAEKSESSRLEKETLSKREQDEYDSHFSASSESLKSHPVGSKYFAPSDADPEGSKILTEGYDKFDTLKTTLGTMKPDERAAVSAVIRARFAAMPRVAAALTKATAEIESLKAELGKFKKSDPGSATAAPSGGASSAPIKDITSMAAEFDKV